MVLINRVAYYGDSSELDTAINKTLHNMPREIALFAAERCSFISIGKAAMGMVLPGRIGVHYYNRRSRNMWIIILDENIPDKDLHGAIAHEVAHAWLGHDRLGEMPND